MRKFSAYRLKLKEIKHLRIKKKRKNLDFMGFFSFFLVLKLLIENHLNSNAKKQKKPYFKKS